VGMSKEMLLRPDLIFMQITSTDLLTHTRIRKLNFELSERNLFLFVGGSSLRGTNFVENSAYFFRSKSGYIISQQR